MRLDQITYNDPNYNKEKIDCVYEIIKDGKSSITPKNKEELIFKQKIQKSDCNEYFLQNLNSIAWAIDILRKDHYLTWWHEKTRGEDHSTFEKTLIYNIGLFMCNTRYLQIYCDEKIKSILEKLEKEIGTIAYNERLSPQALYNLTYGCQTLSEGHYNFVTSSVIFIRIAIEKKLKWMLGIKDDNASYSLSKMIGFLEKDHRKYFDLPVDVDFNKLKIINSWCNQTMIHGGLVPYLWVLWKAIETVSPLFRTERNGQMNLEGFTYRKNPNEDLHKKVKKFKKSK